MKKRITKIMNDENNNLIEDTCDLIEKIKKVLDKNKITALTNYKLEDKFYLITEFMIITYSEDTQSIDIAFHVATRPDVSSFYTLALTDFDEIKDINIMEVYIKDENGKILTGNKCIERHQKNVKDDIIGNFVGEQATTHYLHTYHCGSMC
jgi:hypothetical protein